MPSAAYIVAALETETAQAVSAAQAAENAAKTAADTSAALIAQAQINAAEEVSDIKFDNVLNGGEIKCLKMELAELRTQLAELLTLAKTPQTVSVPLTPVAALSNVDVDGPPEVGLSPQDLVNSQPAPAAKKRHRLL